MVKIEVECIKCKKKFFFDTEDPKAKEIIYKAAGIPRIFVYTCPRPECSASNRVSVPR